MNGLFLFMDDSKQKFAAIQNAGIYYNILAIFNFYKDNQKFEYYCEFPEPSSLDYVKF